MARTWVPSSWGASVITTNEHGSIRGPQDSKTEPITPEQGLGGYRS